MLFADMLGQLYDFIIVRLPGLKFGPTVESFLYPVKSSA